MKRLRTIVLLCTLFALAVLSQEPPAGWKFSGAGQGGVTPDGHLYVECTRQQEETDWLSAPLPLVPGGLYRLDFDLLVTPENADGNVTPGLVNYSVDTKRAGNPWQHETFTLPAAQEPERMRLRLGAWKLGGRAEFANWRLKRVLPIYRNCGSDIALGAGELLEEDTYTFRQAFTPDGPARTRVIDRQDLIRYNTSRFCFETASSSILYAFHVPQRRQVGEAQVELVVNYHTSGTLVAEVSNDGEEWHLLGTQTDIGTLSAPLPASLYPAEVIYLRLRCEGSPVRLQVNRVCYSAKVEGAPLPTPAIGQTLFAVVETPPEDECLAVEFLPIPTLLPGKHDISLSITNQSARELRLQPTATLEPQPSESFVWRETDFALPPQQSKTLTFPCPLPDAGNWKIRLDLGGDTVAAYTIEVPIPEFQRLDYGAVLAADEAALLWCAEAGWHISQERIPPVNKTTALRMQAAANEAEAIQLVLRPSRPLYGVTLQASDLLSANGAILPAAGIDLLQEYYHNVETPTDAYGYQGLVPDALPPMNAPLDLLPNLNHPFWVRVKVPAGTPAGVYTGTITVQDANGYSASVPLEVEVFGFGLPDRMTLETAFGLSPHNLWLYHKPATEEQRRAILDQYLQALADHHLSPYNPVPLDPWKYTIVNSAKTVTWKGSFDLDTAVKHSGESALRLTDESKESNCICTTAQALPLPDAPLRFSLRYRTAEPGQVCTMFVCFLDEKGRWLPGRNQTFLLAGDGTWQIATEELAAFPAEAKTFTVNLAPAPWAEDGHTTGIAWFDDLIFQSADDTIVMADDFEPSKLEDFQIVFDWTRWDAAVQRALDLYHFNTLDIVPDAIHAAVEIDGKKLSRFGGFLEGTPEFTYLHRQYLHGIQEHLREKGWLDMSYVYWFDEPEEEDYPYVMNGFRKLREGAPDLRRMLTEQVEPALYGGPNLWCPVTYNTSLPTIAERQAVGEDFWWYVCTGPKMPYATLFVDHPASNLRVWLWQTWQNHVQGVLIWATNYWNCDHLYSNDHPQNPYLDPMSWASGYNFVKPGQRLPWGNGDGRFFYPPLAALNRTDDEPCLAPPVASIRAEMLRDGIEDYEYCVILRDLRNNLAASLSPDELARIDDLLTVPSEISQDMTHFTHDPRPILERRQEIGRAITNLLRK